jgi:hypothetical protein
LNYDKEKKEYDVWTNYVLSQDTPKSLGIMQQRRERGGLYEQHQRYLANKMQSYWTSDVYQLKPQKNAWNNVWMQNTIMGIGGKTV